MVSLSRLERVAEKQSNDVGIAEVKTLYRLIAENLRPAAEAGNAQAQYRLALMVRWGRGVAKDPVEAVKWYRHAAEQGHSDSANGLGLQYHSGVGVAKDLAEAAKWFRKAAEAGNVAGAANLASIYASKQATPQELAEAVKWYRKAAERKNTEAQTRLAALYTTGRGVPKDEAEAVKWYRKAEAEFSRGVARGDPLSLNNLAWLLATAVSDRIRDGRRAVEYAEKAVAATARKNAIYIDTLAAAYAEIGQFEKAIETQKEAIAVFGDESYRDNFERHLKSYEAKSPFREQ
jgi:TPR repeat protein